MVGQPNVGAEYEREKRGTHSTFYLKKPRNGKGRGWHVGWAPPVRLTTDRNCGFTDFATWDVYSVGPPFFLPFSLLPRGLTRLTRRPSHSMITDSPQRKNIYICIKIVCLGMGTRGIRKGQFVGGVSKRHL